MKHFRKHVHALFFLGGVDIIFASGTRGIDMIDVGVGEAMRAAIHVRAPTVF